MNPPYARRRTAADVAYRGLIYLRSTRVTRIMVVLSYSSGGSGGFGGLSILENSPDTIRHMAVIIPDPMHK
jgi:hypothetical protein